MTKRRAASFKQFETDAPPTEDSTLSLSETPALLATESTKNDLLAARLLDALERAKCPQP